MAERTPQEKDLLILDGRARKIVRITHGVVEFDHPNKEAEVARREAMATWKKARNAAVEKVVAETDAEDPAVVRRQAEEAFRTENPPPEGSRQGAVGAQWLDLIDVLEDGRAIWGARARVSMAEPSPTAIVLTPAVAEVHNG